MQRFPFTYNQCAKIPINFFFVANSIGVRALISCSCPDFVLKDAVNVLYQMIEMRDWLREAVSMATVSTQCFFFPFFFFPHYSKVPG